MKCMLLVHTLAGLADLKRFIVLDLCTFLGYEIRIVAKKHNTPQGSYIVRYRTYRRSVCLCARVCILYILYIHIYYIMFKKASLNKK